MVIKIFIGHFTRLTNSPSVFAGARAQVGEGGVTKLWESESGGGGGGRRSLGLGSAPGPGGAVWSKRAGPARGPLARTELLFRDPRPANAESTCRPRALTLPERGLPPPLLPAFQGK